LEFYFGFFNQWGQKAKKLLTFFFIWWAIDRILTISVGKDMLAGQGGLNSSRNQVLVSNSGRIKYYLLN
jgi:hypothetical protein